MIISIGYVLLLLFRSWSEKRRRNMFALAIKKGLGSKGNVFIQRLGTGQAESRAQDVVRSSLVRSTGPLTETTLMEGARNLVISSLHPMLIINLHEWTEYLHARDAEPADEDCITVLIEASRPGDAGKFLQHELSVASSYKVHLLTLGTMQAWHSGVPFGMVMRCSLDSLVTMAMAMNDDTLTMDEDLEVHSVMTIATEGKPSNLFSPEITVTDVPAPDEREKKTTEVLPDQRPMKDKVLASFITKHNDQISETWSNESLASASSVGRMDMLDMSERGSVDGEYAASFAESGAGERLSELDPTENVQAFSIEDNLKFSSVPKPPNVLVYTGKIDSVRKFEKARAVLQQCLCPERYVIYHLKHEDIETVPWIENTALLVLATKKKYTDSGSVFMDFFRSGGRIISFGCGFDADIVGQTLIHPESWITQLTYSIWSDVSLISGSYTYNVDDVKVDGCTVMPLGYDKEQRVSIVKVTVERKDVVGCAILSQVLLDKGAGDLGVTPEIFNTLKKSNPERFEIIMDLLTSLGMECTTQEHPVLTPAKLLAKSPEIKSSFMESIKDRLSSGILKFGGQSLHFTDEERIPVQENLLPVQTASEKPDTFNIDCYLDNLSTQSLGNMVFFVEVVPTTMTILDGLLFSVPDNVGLLAIARQQTSGKGRGGNSWLSPVGCAMFSLHVRVPLESPLGRAVSFLQHITALAVVNSVCGLPGYQDFDLRLKWPNDIYYGAQMKLGGIIVKSTIMDGLIHATIGCGFNVDNSNPTICINDLVDLTNQAQGRDLPRLTTEQLIGRTVSQIEALIDRFQREGMDSFRQQYYARWLHSNSVVRLQTDGDQEVTVRGLDEYGYLLVETSSGETISVQPDGNSFDMMKNLITLKHR
ncbi:biotin--protein ligase-like [Dreissena polymorpha]|uniref:BPL/LPL catalytic domain-containing protein n=1 Tax=Dreissena polymorpha TaxID=45954 RepID=A0A9D4CPL0_DREPO|nr:biotin--protein ligase-like [Dreissena polymorpha]XP_052242713.1 biotin--protein ligase-like [Dreissena polymorpha]XP_052242714.1 biotin--protein ligase-like [Dreissena polymorpha]KAH3728852.1 hypothetical protein DPMN_054814 [Dreissena polymorpha]